MNEVKLITEDQLNRLMQVKGAKQLQQMYAKTKGQKGGTSQKMWVNGFNLLVKMWMIF